MNFTLHYNLWKDDHCNCLLYKHGVARMNWVTFVSSPRVRKQPLLTILLIATGIGAP